MKILRWLIGASAWAYLAFIVGYWLALHFIGERWWLTTVALYLPHVLLVAPAALLVLLLAIVGPRRFVPVPLVAVLVLLFPIMGLVVFGGSETSSGAPRLRLLSYNVNSGRGTADALAAQVLAVDADIVVMVEGVPDLGDQITAKLPGFARHGFGEFYVASRWPIVQVIEPARVDVDGVGHVPRFMRYVLATPLGPIDLFLVHPKSPRAGFETIRGTGLVHEVESGGIFSFDRRAVIGNTALRRAQARSIYELARTATHPVIIAGDTNLPHGSGVFADTIGHFQDGFATVGRGLGYTFPTKRGAWMRIDRILAGPQLRFLAFDVGTSRASDHYCVWADLERRQP